MLKAVGAALILIGAAGVSGSINRRKIGRASCRERV